MMKIEIAYYRFGLENIKKIETKSYNFGDFAKHFVHSPETIFPQLIFSFFTITSLFLFQDNYSILHLKKPCPSPAPVQANKSVLWNFIHSPKLSQSNKRPLSYRQNVNSSSNRLKTEPQDSSDDSSSVDERYYSFGNSSPACERLRLTPERRSRLIGKEFERGEFCLNLVLSIIEKFHMFAGCLAQRILGCFSKKT